MTEVDIRKLEAFRLKFLCNEKNVNIAKMLGVSATTIYSYLMQVVMTYDDWILRKDIPIYYHDEELFDSAKEDAEKVYKAVLGLGIVRDRRYWRQQVELEANGLSGIGTLVINTLRAEGIYTADELLKITDKELRRIPNFGKAAMADVNKWKAERLVE